MSETAPTDAKQRPAHWFKPGQSGNPRGRVKGSRSKFSEAFIQDLASVWEQRGVKALEECAATEPGTFLRVCASLMPKDLNLNLTTDAATFATNFRSALALLGNHIEPPRQRRRLPGEHVVIDADAN
jgi:hypothetical protein